MFIGLYKSIFGFLKIELSGDFKERAMTLCAQNGIILLENRLHNGKIQCFISVKDFKILKYLLKGEKVRVHIVKKYGFPFLAKRYKKRVGILAGALLMLVILQFMTGYIWVIDINGNEKINEETVLAACKSIGIVSGIRKNSIYPKLERERLMLRLDGVAWCSINIEGSRLTVNVTEAKEKADKKEGYTNLVASADGIIEKIDIVSGTSAVKVGQAVKKGDLLVSGIIETTDGTRFTRSKGSVLANSQKQVSIRENFKQKGTVNLNKSKIKSAIELYGMKLPLYLGSETGEYDTELKVNELKLFNCQLPIKLYTKKYIFKKEITATYDKAQIAEKLERRLLEMSDVRVLSKNIEWDTSGGTLKAVIEKSENIASEQKLVINAGN